LARIDKGLKPFRKLLKRDVTQEDLVRLTEIKIKRISRFDAFKADEQILGLEGKIAVCVQNLEQLTEYAIAWYQNLKKKYSAGKERKTEIRQFDTIELSQVVINNEKLYVNREEGFAGYGIKKDEYVSDCSDIDDLIVIRADGKMLITKVSDKAFVGKEILHISVFRKNDDRTTYNVIYQDGKTGPYYVKRFSAGGVIRDKEYDLTKETKGSRIVYLSANANGECESLHIFLKPRPKLKKTSFEFDFASLGIKGRGAGGNTLTKLPIRKIMLKEKGQSTLSARQVWWDESVKRINTDGRGELLGSFGPSDKVFTLMQSGNYRIYPADPALHFEEDLIHIEKFRPAQAISVVYFDGETKEHMVKRFVPELSDRKVLFISEAEGSTLLIATTDTYPRIQVEFPKMGKVDRAAQEIDLESFIGVKGLKAKGKKLANHPPKKILVLESLPEPELPVEEVHTTAASTSEVTTSAIPNIVADLEGDDPQMRLFESDNDAS
jgi:topoisomerase-4 subunit A